jgi:hypothetical protein
MRTKEKNCNAELRRSRGEFDDILENESCARSGKEFCRFLKERCSSLVLGCMKTNSVAASKIRNPASPQLALRPSTQFPADLRVWLEHSSLLQAAHGIAQKADIAAVHPVFSNWTSKFQDPWRMLALVTCAYASGLFDDRTIAGIAAAKPEYRELFRGEPPSIDAVSLFRERTLSVISSCLGNVILHVWCHGHGKSPTALHPILVVDILCEARARVQRAFDDSAASQSAPVTNRLSGR